MRKDSRLSRVLHVLIHLHAFEKPATSEQLATMLSTNAVVVRRTMALLKEAGYVNSVKGHHGGWTLTMPLTDITLYDIHTTLKEGSVFTIGLTDEHHNCPIEKAVNLAISDVMNDAEALMLQRFKAITLARLAGGFPPHNVG